MTEREKIKKEVSLSTTEGIATDGILSQLVKTQDTVMKDISVSTFLKPLQKTQTKNSVLCCENLSINISRVNIVKKKNLDVSMEMSNSLHKEIYVKKK